MTLEEVLLRLVLTLKEKFHNKIMDSDINFNKYLDSGTGILSGILQRLLEKNNWDKDKWIDDILIKNIKVSSNLITIYGNVIYGKSGTTKEWVSPLLFQIFLNMDWTNFVNYKCYFGAKDEKELDYLEYYNEKSKWEEYFNRYFYDINCNWEYVILKN